MLGSGFLIRHPRRRRLGVSLSRFVARRGLRRLFGVEREEIVGVPELELECTNVAGIDRLGADLLDDGKKVVQRAYRSQGRSLGGAKETSGSSEGESRLDDGEGDLLVVETTGESPVLPADFPHRRRRAAIAFEQAPDVGLTFQGRVEAPFWSLLE